MKYNFTFQNWPDQNWSELWMVGGEVVKALLVKMIDDDGLEDDDDADDQYGLGPEVEKVRSGQTAAW